MGDTQKGQAEHSADERSSLVLSQADFEVISTALALSPDIRVVAIGLKRSRILGITYPIDSAKQLVRILGSAGELNIEGHSITEASLREHVLASDFPIASEEILAMVLYMAQQRCRHRSDLAAALRAFESQLRAESVASRG